MLRRRLGPQAEAVLDLSLNRKRERPRLILPIVGGRRATFAHHAALVRIAATAETENWASAKVTFRRSRYSRSV